MRLIKFRAWMRKKMWDPFDIYQEWTDQEESSLGWRKGTIFLQFTGLKDKNGKDIYEGDLVTFMIKSTEIIKEVIFINGTFAFGEDYDIRNYFHECEVIGNIYENPEIL